MNDLALSRLVASRICHDLISPVGAISNGLELLAMSGDEGQEEAALIRLSADAATAALKFMRIAFGDAAPGDMMAARDIEKIMTRYLTQGRRNFVWHAGQEAISRADAQLLFLGALTVSDAAPIGGQIAVEAVVDHPFQQVISITADRIEMPERPAPPMPRDAHALLLDQITTARGIALDWAMPPGRAEITLT